MVLLGTLRDDSGIEILKIKKQTIVYLQILLLLMLVTTPAEAAFWNKNKNVDQSVEQVNEETVQKPKKVKKYRSLDAEAYSIMTGQPKVNPADEDAVDEDYEVNKDTKYGWFWQRGKKNNDKKEQVQEHVQTPQITPAPVEEKQEPVIDPASASFIKDIEITGNKLIPTSMLLNEMLIHPGDLYTREAVQSNLKAIYDMGYFTEKIRAVPIIHDDKNVTIRISVEEHIPITGFTVTGNNSVATEEIMEILMELLYQPQNVVKMNKTIEKIQELYSSKGYILARVSSVQDDPDGVVNINIDEGIIKSLKVEGNKKTKDFVIQRNILLEEGSAYNETLLKQDLMRLYATQAFKDVTRTIEQDEEDPSKYNVTIELTEQRTGTISLGGGIDTATGLFGTAGFGDNNFRGRGQRVQANFLAGTGTIMSDNSMLDRANWQAEISFFEPKLFHTDNSFLSKVYYRDYASYQIPLAIERRYGFDATVSRQFRTYKNLTGSISLGVESLNLKEGDSNQIKRLYAAHNIPISKRAEQLKDGFFLNVSPALVYDTRDNFVAPRHGTIASLRFDQAFGLSHFGDTHGKLTGYVRQYIPVPHTKRAAFALSAKAAGKLYGDMPEALAYRLGGPYSVRGFKMSGIGTGEGLVMGSAELLLPLPFIDRSEKLKFLENVRITLFADAGKIFHSNVTDKIYDRPLEAITTGAGIKVYVPGVGPLSIDYGFPLTHTGRSASKSGTFTFSAGENY